MPHPQTKDWPTSRAEVYVAIDTERDYQASRWNEKPHEIDSFVTYIIEYVRRLTEYAATSGDPLLKLDAMRKVAGLCVACMEQHGAPQRTGFERERV